MKITDPDVIKNGEKDLIQAIKNDLDLDAVKEILKKRMDAATPSSKGGEIVVYNNKIAFRLDFDIQLNGSFMFDRQGNYIAESENPSEDTPDDDELTTEILDESLEIDLPEYDLKDESDLESKTDDLIDDDISDILTESRDLWEQEKDS